MQKKCIRKQYLETIHFTFHNRIEALLINFLTHEGKNSD